MATIISCPGARQRRSNDTLPMQLWPLCIVGIWYLGDKVNAFRRATRKAKTHVTLVAVEKLWGVNSVTATDINVSILTLKKLVQKTNKTHASLTSCPFKIF